MDSDNKIFFNNKGLVEVSTPIIKDDFENEKPITKIDILRKISSGSSLRESLNDIVNGEMGAIILINNMRSSNIFQGGFKVNCKFTPKRLTELAKMDGAIILSEDFKRIMHANALLIPDSGLESAETGIRHQTAERVAKQIKGIVIAVSQRKGQITVYYGDSKYVLQKTEELLRRATETLHILEKQREVFDELVANLNILEVTNLVSVGDVCSILQRIEMIWKIANIINEYIIELGREGIILRMRMREITKGVEKVQNPIIRDYVNKPSKIKQFFDNLNFEDILDSEKIANFLFKRPLDSEIVSRGYRILSKLSLSKDELESLMSSFNNIYEIIEADESLLSEVLRDKSEAFKKDFSHLREQIMVGKKV